MVLEVMILSILVQAWLRGRLDMEIKHLGFIFFLIFILLGLRLLPNGQEVRLVQGPYIHGLVTMALGLVLARQRPRLDFFLIGLGLVLNGLMLARFGRMPVDPKALVGAGQEDVLRLLLSNGSSSHVLMDQATWSYLGDWIYLPKAYLLARVLSPGDIILSLGLFSLFIFKPLRKELSHE